MALDNAARLREYRQRLEAHIARRAAASFNKWQAGTPTTNADHYEYTRAYRSNYLRHFVQPRIVHGCACLSALRVYWRERGGV